MLLPARKYFKDQKTKHAAALKIASLAEYLIPARARELLVKDTIIAANAAREDFKALLKLVPIVLKSSLEDNEAAYQERCRIKRLAILAEIDLYLAQSIGITLDYPIVDFWVAREATIPKFFELFVLIGTLQGSSAHSERVLSRYQRRFGDQNIKDAKEDYVEAAIMAEVNADDFDESLRIVVEAAGGV